MNAEQIAQLAAAAPEWQDRPGRVSTPMDRWGRDHWSLLLYIEDVAVNSRKVDWRRLGISLKNWPMLWAARNEGRAIGRYTESRLDCAEEYGLRLKPVDGEQVTLKGVCEVDALMDLADAGLITIVMPPADEDGDYFLKPNGLPLSGEDYPSPRFVTGMGEQELMPWARFPLTSTGRALVNELREHKTTADGTTLNFAPSQRGH